MAHFAELDENNKVLRVVVIADKDIIDDSGREKEEIGIAFCKSLFGENTKWIQTSYNANIRGIYAGIGMTYDEVNNVFISPLGSITVTEIIDAEIVQGAIE